LFTVRIHSLASRTDSQTDRQADKCRAVAYTALASHGKRSVVVSGNGLASEFSV